VGEALNVVRDVLGGPVRDIEVSVVEARGEGRAEVFAWDGTDEEACSEAVERPGLVAGHLGEHPGFGPGEHVAEVVVGLDRGADLPFC